MESNYLFLSFIISFTITSILLIFSIPILRNLKVGQMVREDGPKTHLSKNGTPTMGGLIMLIGYSITFILFGISFINLNVYEIFKFLFPCYIYLLIGFIDDLLIILKGNNKGLTPRVKIIMQVIGILIYYFVFLRNHSTIIDLFYVKVDLKKFYFLFVLLIFVSSTNAVNLTDGLDGLASGTLIICFIATTILGILYNNNSIVLFSVTIIASLLSFLMFNYNPAKIFMGNAGSLMFGAVLSTVFIILNEEMFILIIGIVFIIETLSVIIQVIYFKITKGKRIFLMSPLHHHFEMKGYSEVSIDLLFWLIALIASILLIFSLL